MAAKVLAGGVLVDSAGVGHEVFVDAESDGDGSLCHDLSHDVGLALDRVGGLGESLVVSVLGSVAALRAGGCAGWGLEVIWALWVLSSWLNVVRASRERVWAAGGARANVRVVTSSHDTSAHEVLPCSGWLATVATHREAALQARAASEGVSWRHQHLAAGLNAVAVIEGLGGAERPARSA